MTAWSSFVEGLLVELGRDPGRPRLRQLVGVPPTSFEVHADLEQLRVGKLADRLRRR